MADTTTPSDAGTTKIDSSSKAKPPQADEPEVQSTPPIPEPKLLSPEEAMRRATSAHDTVEQACMAALQTLDGDDGGYHEEVATARGSIRTLLFQLRAGWPGGKKVVEG